MDRDNLLTYPDFNEEFKIHTDASDLKLRTVISHKVKLITFYGRKITEAQQSSTVTERGLIRIVETLKWFGNILLGQRLRIYTDHKNLICKNFYTDRLWRWRLLLEEYSPKIEYIKGDKNVLAYILSMFFLNGNQETTQNSNHKN